MNPVRSLDVAQDAHLQRYYGHWSDRIDYTDFSLFHSMSRMQIIVRVNKYFCAKLIELRLLELIQNSSENLKRKKKKNNQHVFSSFVCAIVMEIA